MSPRALLLPLLLAACTENELKDLEPALSLSPESLHLAGPVGVPLSGTLTLSNGGHGDAQIDGVDVDAPFTVELEPFVLEGGAQRTLEVTWTPAARGAVSGTLSVRSDQAGEPPTAELTGLGLAPELRLTPPEVALPLDGDLHSELVRVENSGDSTLTFGAPAQSGSGAFQVSGAPAQGAVLEPGESLTLEVSGRSSAAAEGALALPNDSWNQPDAELPLRFEGLFVEITAPGSGTVWSPEDLIGFEGWVGSHLDPATLSLQWSSDLDGPLGEDPADEGGVALLDHALSAGQHVVTLSVDDGGEWSASDSITLEVDCVDDIDGDGICDEVDDCVRDGLLDTGRARWWRYSSGDHLDPSCSDRYCASEAGALLASYGFTNEPVRYSDQPFTEALLDEVGVVVFDTRVAVSEEKAALLATWVEKGGSLLLGGYHPNYGCTAIGNLPASWGLGCDSAGIGWNTTSVLVSHDITSGVSEVRAASGESWTASSPATALIDGQGWAAVSVVEPGCGRVATLSDDWAFYDSGSGAYDISYGSHRRLIDNLFAWLTSR